MNCFRLAVSVSLVCLAAGCADRQGEVVMNIFHAGSLSVPFERFEEEFEAQHPGVDVRRQAYGSAMAIRQVTELSKAADVVASADYRLIDEMMIGAEAQWAEWNLMFARNSVCITLSPAAAAEINSENWLSELASPNRRIAMSNPNHDPCGYRTLMTLFFAQEDLGADGLFDNLVLANSNIELERTGGRALLKVPAELDVTGNLVVRPKETDLIPLLEVGAVDILFIYRSVALQHGLAFVELADEINLCDPTREAAYNRVAVSLNADSPESVLVRAGAIVYGITVPVNAPNPALAREFVELVISDEGAAILDECGQEPISPARASKAGSRPDFAGGQN